MADSPVPADGSLVTSPEHDAHASAPAARTNRMGRWNLDMHQIYAGKSRLGMSSLVPTRW